MSGTRRAACAVGSVLWLLAAVPAPAEVGPEDAVELFKKAWYASDFGRWREAAILYGMAAAIAEREDEILVARPMFRYGSTYRQNFLPRYYRGEALLRLRLYGAAGREWRAALAREDLPEAAIERRRLRNAVRGLVDRYPGLLRGVLERADATARLLDELRRSVRGDPDRVREQVAGWTVQIAEELAAIDEGLRAISSEAEIDRSALRGRVRDRARVEKFLSIFEQVSRRYRALDGLEARLRDLEESAWELHADRDWLLRTGARFDAETGVDRDGIESSTSRGPARPALFEPESGPSRAPALQAYFQRARTAYVCPPMAEGSPATEGRLFPRGMSQALVIAAGNYRGGAGVVGDCGAAFEPADCVDCWQDLPWALSNSHAAGEILERHGFQVERLCHPDTDTLEDKLQEFADRVRDQADRVVVYYAGNALSLPVEGEEHWVGFAVPRDAPFIRQPGSWAEFERRVDEADVDWFIGRRNTLSLEAFRDRAEALVVPHVLLIFDTGIDGSVFTDVRALLPHHGPRRWRQSEDLLCSHMKKALENSVIEYVSAGDREMGRRSAADFVRAITKALGGRAPAKYDQCRYLRAKQMFLFLRRSLGGRRAGQRPQHGALGNGRFVFEVPNMAAVPCGAGGSAGPSDLSPSDVRVPRSRAVRQHLGCR